MLSTQYRLRLESICTCIANKEQVPLEDMIWAEKLAKAHTTARDWLNKARRQAAQDIQEGSIDDFMNKMGLGDPDPSNYKTGFDGADEIVDWFKQDKPDDWRTNVTKFLMFTKESCGPCGLVKRYITALKDVKILLKRFILKM